MGFGHDENTLEMSKVTSANTKSHSAERNLFSCFMQVAEAFSAHVKKAQKPL